MAVLGEQPSSIKKNKFDLSFERKMSMDMGKLYPMLVKEAIPGDVWNIRSEVFIRFAPLVSPVMHRINVYCHYFFVPNRIIWDDWEDFITGGDDGTLTPTHPYVDLAGQRQAATYKGSGTSRGSLVDYMGISPSTDDGDLDDSNPSYYANALPFRAYAQIYNDWYRDIEKQPELTLNTVSGEDIGYFQATSKLNGQAYTIQYRNWEKDQFTTSFTEPQLGEAVTIPGGVINSGVKASDGSLPGSYAAIGVNTTGAITNSSAVAFELTSSDGALVTDLRRAVRLQEFLELQKRAGSRYKEVLKAFFGVSPQDHRLDRAEYIGGGKTPVKISEVLQSAPAQAGDVYTNQGVGDLYGHGIAASGGNKAFYKIKEHGWILGIISVLPRTGYQNCFPKKFHYRPDRFTNYYWSQFAHLGEEEVKHMELNFEWDKTYEDNENTWGYQQRYYHLKMSHDEVCGDFRALPGAVTDDPGLSHWHLSRFHGNSPIALNGDYLKAEVDKRIFAVTDEDIDSLYVQIYHKIDALRPIPYFSNPTM